MIDASALPDVRAFLEKANSLPGPPLHEMTPQAARALSKNDHLGNEPEVGLLGKVRDESIRRSDGTALHLRVFDRRTTRGSGPVLIFFHGGGWILGSVEQSSSLCAEISRQLDLPVIAVEYRLAPEYPWPAAPDDAELAARTIATWPQVTGLILAGDSAGGNLAAVTALALRDPPAAVPVLAQWLIYPAVHPGMSSRSFQAYGQEHGLTREAFLWCVKHYGADQNHWRAWPMHAVHAGLPPTLLVTAALDVLADQGREYAERCRQQGVHTLIHEAPGRIHGFMTCRKSMPSGQEELGHCLARLKTLLR